MVSAREKLDISHSASSVFSFFAYYPFLSPLSPYPSPLCKTLTAVLIERTQQLRLRQIQILSSPMMHFVAKIYCTGNQMSDHFGLSVISGSFVDLLSPLFLLWIIQ